MNRQQRRQAWKQDRKAGMTYSDVLAKRRIGQQTLRMAMEDQAVQLAADIKCQQMLWGAVIALNERFGFGEKRLTYFLANHKRLFDRQNRLVIKGEQTKYLNTRMDEIFKKEGFPQDFIDRIIGKVEIIDAPKEDR